MRRSDRRDPAIRAVAKQAHDREDVSGLSTTPGLDGGDGAWSVLSQPLAHYVGRVAAAVGVPAHAVGYEVSDTATAYLGLTHRLLAHAGRDLMLLWDEKLGWYVAIETHPGEPPLVLSHLRGDAVPAPDAVARFVAEVLASGQVDRLHPVPPPLDRISMAKKMMGSA